MIALWICAGTVSIDDGAAIDRADDAPDATAPSFDTSDFGNLRQIAREDELDETPRRRLWARASPAGLLRRSSKRPLARGAFVEESLP